MIIRELTADEVVDASNLGNTIYPPALFEPVESFASKQAFFPEGCLGAFEDDKLVGYVFSHPWRGHIPPLGAVIPWIPCDADYLFIADLAVLPKYRNHWWGSSLAVAACAAGLHRGYTKFLLASVNDSCKFWQRLGFTTQRTEELAPGITAHVMGMTHTTYEDTHSAGARRCP